MRAQQSFDPSEMITGRMVGAIGSQLTNFLRTPLPQGLYGAPLHPVKRRFVLRSPTGGKRRTFVREEKRALPIVQTPPHRQIFLYVPPATIKPRIWLT